MSRRSLTTPSPHDSSPMTTDDQTLFFALVGTAGQRARARLLIDSLRAFGAQPTRWALQPNWHEAEINGTPHNVRVRPPLSNLP